MSEQLSPHFTVADLSRSQTATRLEIDNTPDAVSVENLRALCVDVLEHVWTRYRSIQIDSGFRGLALNMRIGGAKNSQHRTGEAADIIVSGITNRDLFLWIKANLQFDQLILEFDDPKTHGGWVHVSFSKTKNRNQCLVAVHAQSGKTEYHPWVD